MSNKNHICPDREDSDSNHTSASYNCGRGAGQVVGHGCSYIFSPRM